MTVLSGIFLVTFLSSMFILIRIFKNSTTPASKKLPAMILFSLFSTAMWKIFWSAIVIVLVASLLIVGFTKMIKILNPMIPNDNKV